MLTRKRAQLPFWLGFTVPLDFTKQNSSASRPLLIQPDKALPVPACCLVQVRSPSQRPPLADAVADEPRAADLSHSLAVPQDAEHDVEALIQFQLSELLDIIVHNEKYSWKTNSFVRETTLLGHTQRSTSDSTASSSQFHNLQFIIPQSVGWLHTTLGTLFYFENLPSGREWPAFP